MKLRGILAIILLMGWCGLLPAYADDCCHHGNHRADCGDYDADCCHRGQGNGHCRGWAPSNGVADLQTTEGRVTEIDYLPGATPGSGMVEVHLQSAGHSQLVRLAPVRFLKQGGLTLREGDTVTLKGFLVTGMEGDLLVATEIRKGEKRLTLRDALGHPTWQ